jgi:hypothetical protein
MKIWQNFSTNFLWSYWYQGPSGPSRSSRSTFCSVITRNLQRTFRFCVLCATLSACGTAKAPDRTDIAAGSSGSQANTPDASSPDAPDASSVDASIPLVITPISGDEPRCTSPYAPVLESVPTGAILPVFARSEDQLEVGSTAADAGAPPPLLPATSIQLPNESGELRVLAQLTATDCASAGTFDQIYSVQSSFAPAADLPGSTAISKDDPRFGAWASRVLDVHYGANVSSRWQTPDQALGPAGDDTTAVVSLGEGGSIALGFDAVLTDGDGYDFAVFENGFSDNYLELAFVEVSSDGTHFARFDAATLVNARVPAYGTMDPELLQGFAGKYRVGWATPFDLTWLKWQPEVRSNLVDLSHITVVRVVDIVGDGRTRDSFGHVVYDPYPGTDSAGFDLDAIGLLNVAP